jgi:aminoglycoside 2''-phosphotransferase
MIRRVDLLDRVRDVLPALALREVREVAGQGQNNVVLVVDEQYVFRFPLYEEGVVRLEREVAILRTIHGRLATPDPVFASLDDRSVGRAFIGYPLISGEPLRQSTLDAIDDEADLSRLGEQIGGFLRELHALPVAQVLPDEFAGFEPTAAWRDLFARIENKLFPFIREEARQGVRAHFQAFFDRAAGLEIKPSLIHGDFGTGNILWNRSTRCATGVIDWSSAGVGDAAIDVAALPGRPPAFRRGLLAAYPLAGEVEERVAFYHGTFALQEALFGVENGDQAAFEAGIAPYR